MAIIKKRELEKMSIPEAEKKIKELQMSVLENEGKGEREKRNVIRKTVAKLNTHIAKLKKKEPVKKK